VQADKGEGVLYARLAVLLAFVLGWAGDRCAAVAGSAAAYPVYPASWLRQARCIHHFEVYGHEGRADEWTVVGGGSGGFQFTQRTWESVGGRGSPSGASPAEQTYRAYLVWKRDGGSWREWRTHALCGV